MISEIENDCKVKSEKMVFIRRYENPVYKISSVMMHNQIIFHFRKKINITLQFMAIHLHKSADYCIEMPVAFGSLSK